MRKIQKPATVLHSEGKWELLDATNNNFHASSLGWKSVIKHRCIGVVDGVAAADPYWMLLEHAMDRTVCMYCGDPIPASIVGLFKLQNWENIK